MTNIALPIISLLAICLWPFNNFLDTNLGELRKADIFSIWQPLLFCLFVFSILLIVTLAVRAITKRHFHSIFSAGLVLVGIFFFFKPAYQLSGNIITAIGFERGAIIGVLIFACLVCAIAGTLSRFEITRKSLYFGIVVASFTPLIMNLPSLASSIFFEPETNTKIEERISPVVENNLPNIYYIVSDGMIGERGYQTVTGQSLLPFVQSMETLGFSYIPEARSNYIASASSIGSLFHLDYFRDENSDQSALPNSSYFPAITYRKQPSELFRKLRSLGYDLNMSGSWYSGCRKVHMDCINREQFHPNREAQILISRTPLPLIYPAVLDKKIDSITPVTEYLEKLVEKRTESEHPQFTFIHHMQPHSPWYVDGECNRINVSAYNDGRLYQYSVECIEKTVTTFMTKLSVLDPNAIVVLHGDHGWLLNDQAPGIPEYEWSDDLIDQRSEILNIIKSPEECKKWLKDDLGPINTLRFVLSCVQRKAPEYLEEKLLVPGQNYEKDLKLIRRRIG
ncbi:sulfatase-like hydrolase/transferase [Thalassospira lucentensis]|uniref:sulfatase-like hydrolase/transferase n=1 Tax=Thalassospira lucentensis TaxID=168935 RepID=UPI00142E1247|nr:sulfatase-like hydrolase/transferase [Thalassospira lucentensis]NIZ00156.1 LTA synthase family protein [Thalassospira lucentensis]